MTTTTEFAPEQSREAWDRIHELEKLRHTDLAMRCYTSEGKLDAEMKRTAEAMQLVHDRTARGDSWMEMCDELEAKLKAATSRLDTYEKWFSDNAVNLAAHNIGGFSMSPYGAAVRADTFPEPVVETQKPKCPHEWDDRKCKLCGVDYTPLRV